MKKFLPVALMVLVCTQGSGHLWRGEETMKRQRKKNSLLIPGVKTVPDAILELVN